MTTANFWFDPICPWAWITSRWILEVQKVRPIEINWNIMSLAYLNIEQHKGEQLTEAYMDKMHRAWGPGRIFIAAADSRGDEILLPLYSAMGKRFHEQQRRDDPLAITEALLEVGLPISLANAADTSEFDQKLISSHLSGIELVGIDVGTPILGIGDKGIFGPVISPAPRGEKAGLVWDAVVLLSETDGFLELKRSRDRRPSFG